MASIHRQSSPIGGSGVLKVTEASLVSRISLGEEGERVVFGFNSTHW